MHSFDVDPLKRGGDGENSKKIFKASTKKQMQLTFENIVIKTIPKQKKCGKGKNVVVQPKVILNDVSGTILPG